MAGHLIHIGYPRAGSSTLQDWFERHPQLVYQANQLGGYDALWRLAEQPDMASDSLRWHVSSSESIAAPPPRTVRDMGSFEAHRERRARVCETLRMLCGGATILIVTRGFRDILGSIYARHVAAGGALRPDEMIDRMGSELETIFDYDGVVTMYRAAFGAENVLVLPYEVLRDDGPRFTGLIEARLGLDAAGPPPRWLNRGLAPPQLFWYRVFSRLAGTLASRLGKWEASAFAAYQERIGGPDLNRAIAILARVAPRLHIDRSQAITSATVERLRGRASLLASLPEYEAYAGEYLNDSPPETEISTTTPGPR